MAMTLSEIKKILKADVIVGADKMETGVNAGAGGDLMSDILRGPMDGVVVLSGLNNVQVIRTALIAGVTALVIVRGKKPDKGMIEQAKEHGLPLLSTPFTMFTACGRLFRQGLRGVDGKSAP
jgi:predicted transcriptional regulator